MWSVQLSEVVRNYGLLLAGAIGLWLAWRRVVAANRQSKAAIQQADIASHQATLARREHVAELLVTAAERLSADKLEVRLAAVYILREIGRGYPDLSTAAHELMSAFLRQRQAEIGEGEIPPDVAEMVKAIAERTSE